VIWGLTAFSSRAPTFVGLNKPYVEASPFSKKHCCTARTASSGFSWLKIPTPGPDPQQNFP